MTSSTGTVVFNDAKLQAIDVVATERLGVGTLDPASNLHVVGNVHVTGNVNKLNFTDGYTIKRGANVTVFGTTDVIQEITGPHARESAVLKKYPEVSMRDYTYNGYTVSSSSDQNITREAAGLSPLVDRSAWCAFDNSVNTFWQLYFPASPYDTTSPYDANSNAPVTTDVNNTEHRGHWIKLKLPTRVKLQRMTTDHTSQPERWDSVVLLGSNDDTNWYVIKDTFSLPLDRFTTTDINSDSAYMYILLVVKSLGTTDNNVDMFEIGYYGYEEVGAGDDSVDTTVKSVYNAPDLTSAALYIDAAKTGSSVTDQSGSTPSVTVTATGVTYDSSENAWELTGAATSNIVSGNLGFEGDQPHSVSAWVKADQLNGDGLFHVGTAEGEGDAASRVGFVDDSHISWGGEDHYFSNAEWHNVTYTYNGEGSDKKLYLDGRLVGTAANEDTFGDYPPFAMSTYSEYGYTVSASSEHTSSRASWSAFDDSVSTDGWWTNYDDTNHIYDSSNGNGYIGIASLGGIQGEWLKLECPHKIKVDYVFIQTHATYTVREPKEFYILGSNDDISWSQLSYHTNVDIDGTSGTNFMVNATKAFRYLAIVITEVNYDRLIIREMKFYGHRENDLVRFPDPTNVLKYPHVAMKGTAHRGYVATASSYRADATYDYRPYKAFNGIFNSGLYQGWVSQSGTTEYNGTDYLYNGSINLGTGAQNGEWIKLELPRKILMTSMRLYSRVGDPTRAPEDFIVYGSNDDSNWTELLSEVGATPADTGTTYTADTATTHYKYFALVVRKIAGQNSYLTIDNIEYYGTEEDLDVVARIGDGYDGKVRNLRVFSTALSQDRVQEIFDADKDEFGLAKSSVSVYRGHLGIGTTEPKAALTVMDEVGELEEFPPRGLADAQETYIDGHGVFKIRASIFSTGTNGVTNVFDKKSLGSSASFWLVGNNAGYNLSTGAYEDNVYKLSPSSGTPYGHWVALEMPYKIKLKKYSFMPRYNTDYQAPKDWELWASNNGSTWTKITQVIGNTEYLKEVTYHVDEPNYYKYIAFIVTRTIAGHASNDYVAVAELRYFGTREQGASTLHNGELTLTRNLTVPRIGPALDADDTPRRDRLVVEYNTSTNPTANGTVKDTSGRGLDGLMYNGASYDATEKALVFDGTDDYVSMSDWKYNTGFIHSFSGWIKFKSPEESWNVVYGVGDASGSSRTNFTIWSKTDNSYFRTEADGSGSFIDHTFEFTGNMDKWLHMAVVKSSARIDSTRIYINGVLLPQTGATLADRDIALPNTPQNFNLNGYGPTGGNTGNVNLSNVKFYDVALTADEVKRLYDMGRCDEGHHVVNFSKTRVGIGLGDGEAPRADLDVRGDLHANGSVVQLQTRTFCLSFSSTSTTFTDTGAYVDITPKFSNSKFFVMFDGLVYISANVASGFGIKAFRSIGGGADQRVYSAIGLAGAAASPHDLALYNANGAYQHARISLSFSDTPNTSSSIRYKIYARSHVSGTTVNLGNGGHQPLTFSVFEIGQ